MAVLEKKNIMIPATGTPSQTGRPNINSLDMMKTPHAIRPVAFILLLLIVLVALCLYFVPWQQSVTGQGRVIVFSPMDRPQNIEAQIPGRIVKWNILEGQQVKAGEIVAVIEDTDSKFLSADQVPILKSQRSYLESGLAQARTRESALEGQLKDMIGSRGQAMPSAEQKARQAEDSVRQSEQIVEQAKQSLITAELNLKRRQELFEKGLRSKRDLELAELDIVTARTRLESVLAALEVSRKGLQISRFDRDKITNDTSASINSIRASIASVRETIAKNSSDLQKIEIDIQNVTRRTDQQVIRSPRDGRIVRVMRVGTGETVKAGDILAMLAPETTDQAVELLLSDYDAPLVSPGRQVRLNFAGWPAVQFVGWPSVAVGTFAGRVKVMDAVDDGNSRFRIIITPDHEQIKSGKEEPWPTLDQLRPGAEVNGWIMLDTVTLGWELWRQFNAFPPTVDRGPIGEKSKGKANKAKSSGNKQANSDDDK